MNDPVKQAYDFLATPILMTDQDGIVTYMNQAAKDILTALNQNTDYFNYIKEDARFMRENKQVITALKSVITRKKDSFTFNQFLLNQQRQELFTVKAVPFPKGDRGVILTYEALELEKKSFYQLLLKNSLAGFALHKMIFDQENNPVDYIFLDCNQTFEELTNLKAENILGKRASEVIPGLEETGFIELYGATVLEDKAQKITRYSKPLSRYYEISVLPSPGNKFITNFVDITEEKKRKKELQETKKRLELAIEGANLGFWVWDHKTDKVEFNQKLIDMLGYEFDLLEGNIQAWQELIHDKDKKRVFNNLEEYFANNTSYYECEYRLKTGFNNWKWVKAMGKVIARDETGSPIRTVGVFQNIHKEKTMKLELKLNKFLVDKAPIGIIHLNPTFDTPKGKFGYVNKKACQLLGYSQEELIGKRVMDIDAKYSVEELNLLSQKIKAEKVLKVESQLQTKNGSTFPAEIITRYLEYKDGEYGVAFIHDISQRKEQEKKLKEKNKILEAQFEKGEKIHQQLLPNGLFKSDGVEIATFYQAADKIGADFNQILELEDKIIFYISDTTGHSIDGAFVNIILRESISKFFERSYPDIKKPDLNELIQKIHHKFQKDGLANDYFISLLLFVMDKESKQVRYVNAGVHINPILAEQGEVTQLQASGPPISTAIASSNYDLEGKEFQLKEDSTLVITTDGLIEEERNGEIYGLERLIDITKKNYRLPPENLLELIKADAIEFSGEAQSFSDDLTLVIATNRAAIDRLSLKIPSDFNQLEKVELKARDFISDHYQKVDEILIGLQEIVTNSIEHGNQQEPNTTVKIIISITSHSIVIEVKDQGEGFDWSEKIDKELSLSNFCERGRGIMLAKKAFDHITYNQAGNKAILYKKR